MRFMINLPITQNKICWHILRCNCARSTN